MTFQPLVTPPQDDQQDPVAKILAKHGAKLKFTGGRDSSYKEIAEELLVQLEAERYRTSAVQNNLSAILNQYQVTAASVKAMQARQDEMLQKLQKAMVQLKAAEQLKLTDIDNDTDDDTESKGQ